MKILLLNLCVLISVASRAQEGTSVQQAVPVADSQKMEQVSIAEPSSPSPEKKIDRQSVPERRIEKLSRFFIGALYSAANELKHDSVVVSTATSSLTGTASLGVDTAFGMAAGFMETKENSWGYSTSLVYEAPRNINSLALSSGGVSATSTYGGDKSTIQLTTIELNAVYRLERVYFPIGFNISIPNLKRSAIATGTLNVSGSGGAQLGIGFMPQENLVFEILSKATSIRMTGSASGTNFDFGTGYITGLNVSVKHLF